MKVVSEFQFGSSVHGLRTDNSDYDCGVVTLSDNVWDYLLVDSGNLKVPTNKQTKRSYGDFLELDFASLLNQCLNPNAQSLQVVATLTNKALKNMCAALLDYRNFTAFFYRTQAFNNNTKDTAKGRVQKYVATRYADLYFGMADFDETYVNLYPDVWKMDSGVGEALRFYMKTGNMLPEYMKEVDTYSNVIMGMLESQLDTYAKLNAYNVRAIAGQMMWDVLKGAF